MSVWTLENVIYTVYLSALCLIVHTYKLWSQLLFSKEPATILESVKVFVSVNVSES